MDTEIRENDLLAKVETNPLYALQRAIAAMPAVDQDKVEAAIAKLQSGSLSILGTEAEIIACAERIAKQIMDESSNCDSE